MTLISGAKCFTTYTTNILLVSGAMALTHRLKAHVFVLFFLQWKLLTNPNLHSSSWLSAPLCFKFRRPTEDSRSLNDDWAASPLLSHAGGETQYLMVGEIIHHFLSVWSERAESAPSKPQQHLDCCCVGINNLSSAVCVLILPLCRGLAAIWVQFIFKTHFPF